MMDRVQAKQIFENWRRERFPGQEARFKLVGYDADTEVVRMRDMIGKPSGEPLDIDIKVSFMLSDFDLIEMLSGKRDEKMPTTTPKRGTVEYQRAELKEAISRWETKLKYADDYPSTMTKTKRREMEAQIREWEQQLAQLGIQ